MKKLLLLIVLLFVLVPHLNANEFEKKNTLLGIGLTVLLPGAGFIYAEDETNAFLFSSIELGLLSWAAFESINPNEEADKSIIPLGMFFALKFAELIGVTIDIREYNKEYERDYSFEPKIMNDRLNLSIVYKF